MAKRKYARGKTNASGAQHDIEAKTNQIKEQTTGSLPNRKVKAKPPPEALNSRITRSIAQDSPMVENADNLSRVKDKLTRVSEHEGLVEAFEFAAAMNSEDINDAINALGKLRLATRTFPQVPRASSRLDWFYGTPAQQAKRKQIRERRAKQEKLEKERKEQKETFLWFMGEK